MSLFVSHTCVFFFIICQKIREVRKQRPRLVEMFLRKRSKWLSFIALLQIFAISDFSCCCLFKTTSSASSTGSATPTTPAPSNATAEKAPASTSTAATTGTTGASQGTGLTPASSQSDPGAIRATAQMWRCSKIMHLLRDLHPTLLSALEGVVDQVCTLVPSHAALSLKFVICHNLLQS